MTRAGRPVIGICAIRERARWAFWDQEAQLVADSYVAPLQRAGGLAVLLTRTPFSWRRDRSRSARWGSRHTSPTVTTIRRC
jgi:putative glutamine amidotransferase